MPEVKVPASLSSGPFLCLLKKRTLQDKKMPPVHIVAKPHGAICNLDCTYCYYLEKEKLYPDDSRNYRMSDEVLEAYIRQYIESQDSAEIQFAWQGGEPTLLGIEFFEKVVSLQAKYAQGHIIENAFQTNGTLLDDHWGKFLAKNQFLVGISIDGPEELHDTYRVDKGGKPTLQRVLRGLDILKKYQIEFNTLTVVNRQNSQKPLEVYRFLKSIGSKYLQFIPVVEQIADEPDPSGLVLIKPFSKQKSQVSDWSVDPLQYGVFLSTIFDEWVRNDVGKTFVQTFDVALESWAHVPQSLCVFAPTCGRALAIEHNGDLYSCDHFVYPDNKLGNIEKTPLKALIHSPQQTRFGGAKAKGLPTQCQQCEVRFACNGECPKHRFTTTAQGEYGLNYLCAGYKHFFTHIDPYMRFMALQLTQDRAPALVIEWARAGYGEEERKERSLSHAHV